MSHRRQTGLSSPVQRHQGLLSKRLMARAHLNVEGHALSRRVVNFDALLEKVSITSHRGERDLHLSHRFGFVASHRALRVCFSASSSTVDAPPAVLDHALNCVSQSHQGEETQRVVMLRLSRAMR